ncbi:MAG: cation:proton antiporter [archaeon]
MAIEVFVELAVIIAITAVIVAVVRLLKQPLIIGYILTGLLVGPYLLNIVQSVDTIATFSTIGVALLLFIVGLNLSPKVIKEVGKVSLITGVGQVVFTSIIGFFISRMLGFSVTASLYISIALTFSSTIIIMKLLSDKKDLETLYGKISIGFLLVQDIIAVLILVIISSFSNGLNIVSVALITLIKGVILVGLLILISIYVLPKLCRFFASSQEFLFLFSIGWGLGLAALFNYLNFSIEIGALIAGVTLSLSPYNYEISSKMKPLRDFFIILFFIFLGSQMVIADISRYFIPAIIFSLFILIGNPLIVMILMGLMGYSKRNGFLAGLTVAQISEFSLILILLGIRVGHLSSEILALVTIVGLITIAGSTYLILYSDKIYPHLSKYLSIFEKKGAKKDKHYKPEIYDAILFGYNRIGYDFLEVFKKMGKKVLVVDYNPRTIEDLSKKGLRCEYGDVDDSEFLNGLNLKNIKIAVSTIPNFETNMLLIGEIRHTNKRAIIMVISHQLDEASMLYKKGATYVLMPHFLGGQYASSMIDEYGFSFDRFVDEGKKHREYIKKRKQMGHEHPKNEHHR